MDTLAIKAGLWPAGYRDWLQLLQAPWCVGQVFGLAAKPTPTVPDTLLCAGAEYATHWVWQGKRCFGGVLSWADPQENARVG